jgi:hypothetical protein
MRAATSRLLKNSNFLPEVHSAAKAADENRPLIAALKRRRHPKSGAPPSFSAAFQLQMSGQAHATHA